MAFIDVKNISFRFHSGVCVQRLDERSRIFPCRWRSLVDPARLSLIVEWNAFLKSKLDKGRGPTVKMNNRSLWPAGLISLIDTESIDRAGKCRCGLLCRCLSTV